MKTLLAAAAALALVLTTSGCGDGSAKIAVPKAGQCIAKQIKDGDDLAPNIATATSCRKPHSYEVTAVVTIPKTYLVTGSKKAQLARRTELAVATASKQTALGKKFQAAMSSKCTDALFDKLGMSGVDFGGKTAGEVGLDPVASGVSQWLNLTSPGLWKQGDQRVICSARYYDTNDDADVPAIAKIASSSKASVMSTYLSSKFPVAMRSCAYRKTAAACNGTHDTEYLWTFNAADLGAKKATAALLNTYCNASYEKAGFTAGDGQKVVATALSGATTGYTPYACAVTYSSPVQSWSAFDSDAV